MQELSRSTQPVFKTIEKIDYIKATDARLDNGIPVYSLHVGNQDITRVEFIFNAGSWFQQSNLVANAANVMINEGCKNYSSAEIAEMIDFYGAFLQFDCAKHTAGFTLYTLNKYLDETLKITEEIIKSPSFPEKEFSTFINKTRQKFIVENEKIEKLAREKFLEVVYGKNHPYGRSLQLIDFDNVQLQEIKEFYAKYYRYDNCKILLTGKLDENHIPLLNKYFGKKDWTNNEKLHSNVYSIESASILKHHIPKSEAVQCGVRIGKLMFNKLHKDFNKLDVVNTIFGGYFGSRLMSNIREDKGYTYGIGSALVSQLEGGYFVIVSEVGKNVWKPAVNEIYNELKKLRTEVVLPDELALVKNYMMGELVRAFDGAFSLAGTFRSILDYNIGYEYFDNYIQAIQSITPDEIQHLAQTYLHEDSMFEVVAGVD